MSRNAVQARYAGNRTGKLKIGRCIVSEKPTLDRAGFSKHLLRLREIERVIIARHGTVLPETDDADLYIEAAAFAMNAHCLARGGDLDTAITGWCGRWAPWALPRAGAIIRPILNKLVRRLHDLKSDDAARILQVVYAERQMLGLCTIGACDVDRKMRGSMAKNRKRKFDRERQAEIRRNQGRQPRASYLANSISRLQPWVELNISRRTFYRRFGTSPSRVDIDISVTGDTPVPPIKPGAALLALALTAKGVFPSKAEIGADNANGGTEQCDVEQKPRRMGGET